MLFPFYSEKSGWEVKSLAEKLTSGKRQKDKHSFVWLESEVRLSVCNIHHKKCETWWWLWLYSLHVCCLEPCKLTLGMNSMSTNIVSLSLDFLAKPISMMEASYWKLDDVQFSLVIMHVCIYLVILIVPCAFWSPVIELFLPIYFSSSKAEQVSS